MAGLTPTGLEIKTQFEIQEEMKEQFRAVYGSSLSLEDETFTGQLIGIFSEREALIWELLQSVYNGQYPLTAEGVSLDLAASLTAVIRKSATLGFISQQALIGDELTIVPVGTAFSVNGIAANRYIVTQDVQLGAGEDAEQTIAYNITPTSGDYTLSINAVNTSVLPFNHTAQDLEDALNELSAVFGGLSVSGSFAAGFDILFENADGKQPYNLIGVESNNTDAVITPVDVTTGEYQATVVMVAETAGSATTANARTLTVIENAITGLDFTHNTVDASVGNDTETDSELRTRREQTLAANSAGTLEAIRSALLAIEIVENAIVFENDTGAVDAAGRPPKSFEAFVYQAGGVSTEDQLIADTIFQTKPAGIEAFGDVDKIVLDSQNVAHDISFSRPLPVDIWLELDLTVDLTYPTNGDDQVVEVMVDWGKSLGNGVDVIVSPTLIGQLSAVLGIIDVVVRIGTAPAPTLDDNIPIDDGAGGSVEFSNWDTSRVVVVS